MFARMNSGPGIVTWIVVRLWLVALICDSQLTGLMAQGRAQNGSALMPRIVGGREAKQHQYPWMIGLVDSKDPIAYRGFLCGAVLIHPEWVLTAAHCVEGKEPGDVQALVGVHSLLSNSEGMRVAVSEIFRHPRYHDRVGKIGFDLALLRLESPQRGVVSLGVSFGLRQPPIGQTVRTLGWGRTAHGGFRSFALREVDLPTVDRSSVDADAIYGEALPPDTILAGLAEGGKDTCDGDSGGPLIGWDRRTKGWRLWGVVAGGSIHGCAVEGAYGLYTDVASHRDWLENVIVREFQDWCSLYGISPEDHDSDGDGYANWDEYAALTHPLDVRSRPRLRQSIVRDGEESYPVLAASVRRGARDLEYLLEQSKEFSGWQLEARLEWQEESDGGVGRQRFAWRASEALAPDSAIFYRLRAPRTMSSSVPTKVRGEPAAR